MSLWQAAVLGTVQGLTEFLPVSSSGHLLLARVIFGWPDPGLDFDIALHVGTLLAVLVYFREVWAAAFRANRMLLLKVALATVPAVVAGVLLKDYAEHVFRSPKLVALNLIVVAVVMELADQWGKKTREVGTLTARGAVGLGLAQACALAPGVSRSGSTIAAALAMGFTRESAARISFLMAAPITAGAIAKGALDLYKQGLTAEAAAPMAVGAVVSGIVGYAAVAGLLRYLATRSLRVFVVYRIVFGLAMLVWQWS